ncbi:MAG: MMPL family transporter, partial [Chloroflexota bacterium]
REERLRGYQKIDAIERAGGTASRAVFFSGLIVVLALSAMLIVPNTIFRSLGLGMMVVVIVAVAAALTLLPAVLSIMGDGVNRLRVRKQPTDPDRKGTIWDRIGGAVIARPVVSMVLAVGLLLFFASFYLKLETGFSGVTTLPEEVPSRQAFDILAADFPGGLSTPVEIVVDGEITPEVTDAIASLQSAMAESDAFAESTVTLNEAGDLALISAPLTADFQAQGSADAVVLLRNETIPEAFDGIEVAVLVGGGAAFNVDFFDDARGAQPVVFIWVLGLAFVLLTIMFRSVVISLTSILMNLLSVGAAYGLVVLFFQAGVGPEIFKDISSLFGFVAVDAIEAWLPLMLFSILFGLSMDYQIFLLSRIKEHHDKNGDTTEAVSHGIRSTGAIITGAALIMVAVFGGFALGDLAPLQQMGFGLAVAVLIDATVVRMVLVPASMKLLGEYNWYLPSWLEWMPSFSFEPAERQPVSAAAVSEGGEGPESDDQGLPA